MRHLGGVAWVIAFCCVASIATAQLAPPRSPQTRLDPKRDREAPPLPEYVEEEEAPTLSLPPVEPSPDVEGLGVSGGFVLRGFEIVGSTVFTHRELAETLAPFLDRAVHAETLPAITDALTMRYVDAGYISSGAIVPDQTVENGILELRIIEGHIAETEIRSTGRLHESYVEARLRRVLEGPLELGRLDEGLRVLQLDPRIDRVDAILVPTETLGQGLLRLEIAEANPILMDGRVANDLAPALGGRRATATLEHANVSGFGDTLFASVSGARGLFDFEAGYRFPISPWRTELEVRGGLSEGEIVEGDFVAEDFRNEIESYGLALIQPLWRSLEDEVRLIASLERRTSELSFSDRGTPFLLETNGSDGNRIALLLLRLDTDWVHRELDQVFAARLRATFGLDAWDSSTPNRTPFGDPTLADGEFQAALLQLQYARRVPTALGHAELITRGDLQLASGSLFSLEAFAMGGASTVRGYHENAIVSDNGALFSIEFRLPILPTDWRPHELRIAPFVDTGYAWDDHDDNDRSFDRFYASVGFGLLYRYAERFELRAYFGEPLVRDTTPSGDRLQDRGLHLDARVFVF